jgi:hypothetical protein
MAKKSGTERQKLPENFPLNFLQRIPVVGQRTQQTYYETARKNVRI